MRRISTAILISILACAIGINTMADETTPTPEEIQKQIDGLKKQKDLLDAQKALIDAQKALADAQRNSLPAATQAADIVTAAKNAKDVADAQKALADAQKAKSDAQLAAFKASIGDVPTSGLTGAVDLKGNAGELEAALLASKAVREASKSIAAAVREALPSKERIVALSASDMPTFQALVTYTTQVAIVRKGLDDAIEAAQKAIRTAGITAEAVPAFGMIGTVLDATNKLLSFFRTDFTVGGTTVALEDSLAVNEVANGLRDEVNKKSYLVTLPGVFNPDVLTDPAQFIVGDLTEVAIKRQLAADLASKVESDSAKLTAAIAKESTEQGKKPLQEKLGANKKAADALKTAAGLFDAWFGKLSTADDKGATMLATVVREKAVFKQLDGGHLLILKVQKAGGGFLVKKNLWTSLGSMPLYHMGGAAVSYTLLNGHTGYVESAGVVPIHGGFVKAGDLRAELAGK